jgi:hypothetical protein
LIASDLIDGKAGLTPAFLFLAHEREKLARIKVAQTGPISLFY